ncbi:hypothetical protein VTN00DRAFT_7861 [Thermoascus crustaceus]|uniref:uncharacterized protein n=1 Tax=Thermoascus crustaceus TaxID=5088 RepID=UPI00374232D6
MESIINANQANLRSPWALIGAIDHMARRHDRGVRGTYDGYDLERADYPGEQKGRDIFHEQRCCTRARRQWGSACVWAEARRRRSSPRDGPVQNL